MLIYSIRTLPRLRQPDWPHQLDYFRGWILSLSIHTNIFGLPKKGLYQYSESNIRHTIICCNVSKSNINPVPELIMCTTIAITTGTKVNIQDLLMLFGLLPTLLGGKTEISMLGFMCFCLNSELCI